MIGKTSISSSIPQSTSCDTSIPLNEMLHVSHRSTVLSTKVARWRARPPRSLVTILSPNNRPQVSQRPLRLKTASFSSSSSNSTSSRVTPNNEVGVNQDHVDSVILLYQRNSERNVLPRAAFIASSVNSLYWIWYVFDFVPAVNSSPIAELHMDPAFGLFGLGLGLMIQSVFTLYPLSLVSKLEYDPATQHVRLWSHSLPMVRPSKAPNAPIPLGDVVMDKASSDTTKILTDLEGMVEKFQGYLGVTVGKSILPFLIEIRQPEEIHNSRLFLEVLLDPHRLKHQRTTTSQSNRTGSQTSSHPQKSRTNSSNIRSRRR